MKSLGIASLLLLAACGGAPPRSPSPDPRVGVFTSSARTFRTNSFWIEGPTGLVLIDAQFLPSEGLRAVEHAERATGKRVELAIVLHANPDKFNGTDALRARGIRVITSEQVRALIPEVFERRTRAFAARYPGEWPASAPLPDAFGSQTTRIEAAGTALTLHVLGPAVSDAHVAIEWEGHLFVGDLVANRHHAWLELGHTDAWLARLRELAARSPRVVHPGRGRSGGPALLDAQREYLESVVAIARESASEDEARATIEARYPGYGHAVFLRIGLPAVFANVR